QDERQERRQDRPPRRRAGALRVERDLLLLEQLLELHLRLVARIIDGDLRAVGEARDDLALVRVEDDLVDRARVVLRTRDQVGVGDLAGALRVPDQRLARQIDEQDNHDQGEEGAANETVHESLYGG